MTEDQLEEALNAIEYLDNESLAEARGADFTPMLTNPEDMEM